MWNDNGWVKTRPQDIRELTLCYIRSTRPQDIRELTLCYIRSWGPFYFHVFKVKGGKNWDCHIFCRGLVGYYEPDLWCSSIEEAFQVAERFINLMKNPKEEMALKALEK